MASLASANDRWDKLGGPTHQRGGFHGPSQPGAFRKTIGTSSRADRLCKRYRQQMGVE